MRNIQIILTWLLLGCLSFPAWAGQRYQVEVVIFKQKRQSAAGQEWFPAYPAEPKLSDTLIPDADNPVLQTLPETEWQLTSQAKKLARRGLDVVYHQAWAEDIPYKHHLPGIHLQVPIDAEKPDEGWLVNGRLDIFNRGYLRVKFNALTQTADKQHFNTYPSVETAVIGWLNRARLRTNEVHYFDHPLYGMLLQITPLADTAPDGQS